MPQFSYKGRDSHGAVIHGTLDGESTHAIAVALQTKGVTPVTIHEKKQETKKPRSVGGDARKSTRKPNLDDLMFLCRQMHTLSRSGVPLIRGLTGLAETTRNAILARTLRKIIGELEAGYAISQAFNQHRDVFSPLIIGVLQVGENTGRMDEAFLLLAGYLERERDTRTRLKAATRYPMMVLVAIAAAMMVINLFVIPAFAKVFAGFNTQLPWATQILLATSQFTVANWPFVLGGITAAIWLWLRFIQSGSGRLWWDRFKLSLPVIGSIFTKTTLARFSRSFAMMLKSGVPLVQGLTLLASAVDNHYLAVLIGELRRSIERGESIGRTAASLGLFPPLVLQMIDVGEESGRLDEMLDEVADYYESEVDVELKNLSSAIEPLLLIVVGGMVLVLALGVFLPIWDLGKTAIKH